MADSSLFGRREFDSVLVIEEGRTVKNNFTIDRNCTRNQFEQATRTRKITVVELLDGTPHLTYTVKTRGIE